MLSDYVENLSEDEVETEDYGSETDFAKVLNPSDGVSVDYTNPLCPKFNFEEKEKERLLKPFRRTLVVKLMGRQPSFGFMMKKLKQIWERKGMIDIFDLENDFYLVNFQHLDDYMGALIGGPWVISDAYLSVSRWKPEFNPRREKIESLVAWVRFPELPAPLFDKKFLLNLGNAIGKAIRLDIHTAQRTRGKFARMCVELDLTKPLIPSYFVENQKLNIVYESLSMLCTMCGWYGHNKEGCEQFHKAHGAEGMDVEVQGEKDREGDGQEVMKEQWQTVQRVRRPRRFDMHNQEHHTGSRFAVLSEDVGEEVNDREGSHRMDKVEFSVGVVKELRERNVYHQPKQGKQVGMGTKSFVAASTQKANVGRSVQMEKLGQATRREKVLVGRNNEVLKSRVLEVMQTDENRVCRTDSNPELNKWKMVNTSGKENLHPGGATVRSGTKAQMVRLSDDDVVPIESLEASMGGDLDTPGLADC
ncbi:hypothetical protein K1719_038420 [Acacia pycnantha]|nr:hypothetical protein K1719_038420 [Acacia pycnantha]